MGSAPDWIGALATLVATGIAGLAAWLGLRTFISQKTVSDVELSLGIFNEINRYWDRLSENVGQYDYNMGQILAQFEIAAGLFNREILSEAATGILGDHIVEVFSQIKYSPDGERLLSQCCSSPTTFVELQKFLSRKMPQALLAVDFKKNG